MVDVHTRVRTVAAGGVSEVHIWRFLRSSAASRVCTVSYVWTISLCRLLNPQRRGGTRSRLYPQREQFVCTFVRSVRVFVQERMSKETTRELKKERAFNHNRLVYSQVQDSGALARIFVLWDVTRSKFCAIDRGRVGSHYNYIDNHVALVLLSTTTPLLENALSSLEKSRSEGIVGLRYRSLALGPSWKKNTDSKRVQSSWKILFLWK